MKQKIFNIIISLIVVVLGIFQIFIYLKEKEDSKVAIVHIANEESPSFFNKPPQEGLIEALEYYNVKHPKIVHAQAILETNHFKSNLCLNNNNLFGLYNSKSQEYYTFNHWSESVEAYIKMVQYKYKGENKSPDHYYKFLSDIGYAEDSNYINKLKVISNKNDKRRSK